jgi:high-affinity K+ transport system ATPase subunit B
VSEKELADAAQLASLPDETPEGRSIVVLAKERYGIRGRDMGELHAKFVQSAILSAIIFNALIIVALIPLALRGVAYRPIGAASVLRCNLLVYGIGGIIIPFIGIKFIDLIVGLTHLA